MSKKHGKNNRFESSNGIEEITSISKEESLKKSPSCLSFTKLSSRKGSHEDEMESTKPLKRKMSNWTKLKNRLV